MRYRQLGLPDSVGLPFASLVGEKLNEAEIDALMAGQEDENGCINYEGETRDCDVGTYAPCLVACIVVTMYQDILDQGASNSFLSRA